METVSVSLKLERLELNGLDLVCRNVLHERPEIRAHIRVARAKVVRQPVAEGVPHSDIGIGCPERRVVATDDPASRPEMVSFSVPTHFPKPVPVLDEGVDDRSDPAVEDRVGLEVDGPVLEENDFAHGIVRRQKLSGVICRGKTDGCQAVFPEPGEDGIIPFIHQILEIDPHGRAQVRATGPRILEPGE